MNLLLDSNIFLELILDQEKSSEVRALFEKPSDFDFFVTDYSVHSIGLLLFRRNQHEILAEFANDPRSMAVEIVTIPLEEMNQIALVARRFNLDFDDAYQYVAAEKRQLLIVSFDSDFDRTELKRKTPAQLM